MQAVNLVVLYLRARGYLVLAPAVVIIITSWITEETDGEPTRTALYLTLAALNFGIVWLFLYVGGHTGVRKK